MTLTNGNMYHQFVDLVIPSVGLDLVFERTYNSQSDRLGPMGYGWSHTFDVFLADDPGIAATVTDGTGRPTTYAETAPCTYESPPGVFEELACSGPGWELTYVNGDTWTFDSSGKLTSMADVHGNTIALAYDGSSRLQTVTDPLTRVLTFVHGVDDRLDTVFDWTGRTWTFDHDGDGDLISSSTPGDIDTPAAVTTYDYFDVSYLEHNLKQISGPGSSTIDFEYYANDKLFRHIESGVRDQTYYYEPLRQITTVTNSRGFQSRYQYDSEGLIARIEWPDGSAIDYTYDADKNPIEYVDEAGYVWSQTWDSRGRQLVSTNPLSDTRTFTYATTFPEPSTVNDFDGELITVDVDPLTGLVDKVTDPLLQEETRTYDAQGRLLTYVDRTGETYAYTYDPTTGQEATFTEPMGLVWTYGYDTLGRLTSEDNPESETTQFEYDIRDRPTKRIDDSLEEIVTEYDARDRIVKRTRRDGEFATFEYDDLDNLTRIIDEGGRETLFAWQEPGCGCSTEELLTEMSVPGGGVWRYDYDARGRRIRTADPLGRETVRDFDSRGMEALALRPDGSTVTRTYDALGRLTQINAADDVVTFAHDAMSRVTMASNSTTVQAFDYDELGRITRFDDSLTDKFLKYEYDGEGRRTKITDAEGGVTDYAYDAAGRLTTLNDFNNEVFTVVQDGLRRTTSLAYPNSGSVTRQFDNRGEVQSLESSGGVETVFDRTFSRDSEGRILDVIDVSSQSTYGYDSIGRLTQATLATGLDQSYSYDDAGNRFLDSAGQSSNFDAANQIAVDGSLAYGHDPLGNLNERVENETATSFAYDWRERMSEAVLPDGTVVEFRYDPFGRRIEKIINGASTRILRDGEEVYGRYNGSGDVVSKYVRDGLGSVVAVAKPDGDFYLHTDIRGSVVGVTDDGGAIVARFVYDPWGNVLEGSTSWTDPILFIGRDWDDRLEMFDLLARHYDPRLGRFLQEDPLGFGGGDTNLYSYAFSDPINFLDPTGLRGSACPPQGGAEPRQIDFGINPRAITITPTAHVPRLFKIQFRKNGVHLITRVRQRSKESDSQFEDRVRAIVRQRGIVKFVPQAPAAPKSDLSEKYRSRRPKFEIKNRATGWIGVRG